MVGIDMDMDIKLLNIACLLAPLAQQMLLVITAKIYRILYLKFLQIALCILVFARIYWLLKLFGDRLSLLENKTCLTLHMYMKVVPNHVLWRCLFEDGSLICIAKVNLYCQGNVVLVNAALKGVSYERKSALKKALSWTI